MPGVRIDIVRYTDDGQPGFVECCLTDLSGRVWTFEDKVPIVTVEDLDASSDYPRPGMIGCRVLARAEDSVRIGVDPLSDYFECEVPPTAVVDDPEPASPEETHVPQPVNKIVTDSNAATGHGRRRRFGLSLRTLILVVLVLGCGLGWIAYRARVQREAVASIRRYGASVGFNVGWARYRRRFPPPKPPGPEALRQWLGPDYFDTATAVHFSEARPVAKPGGDEVLQAACKLPWLEELSIVFTDATDAGTEGLGRLTRLKSLDLRLNRMSARAVKDFDRLTDLRDLHLASIPLRDEDMGFLRHMPKLESLLIAGRTTTLTDAWMANVEGTANLRSLQLYDIPITSEGLRHLRGHTNMNALNLHNAKVEDLSPLASLKKLGSLALHGSPVEDDGLAVLKELPALYHIDLTKSNVTDRGLHHLAAVPGLTTLNLNETAITDAGLETLGKMSKLTALSVNRTKITFKALNAFRKSHPSIRLYINH